MRRHRGRALSSSFRRFASASSSARVSAGMVRDLDITGHIGFMADPLTGAGNIVIGTEL